MRTARAYYNEHDPYAAEWLRGLIRNGSICVGDVDERDIRDVRPADLAGYSQCHWFAGIGGWPLALRLAGWDDARPVWTGSCPCQPFSTAGKGGGFDDERHLWPPFHHLISVARPSTIFGEQVASKDGLEWLDLVSSDLEGEGYAFGAASLCAAGIGAPHIRQRLFWVAYADDVRCSRRKLRNEDRQERASHCSGEIEGMRVAPLAGYRADSGMGNAGSFGSGRNAGTVPCPEGEGDRERGDAGCVSDVIVDAGSLGYARCAGPQDGGQYVLRGERGRVEGRSAQQSGRTPWADIEWLPCRDGKQRPAQPGIFPLVDGLSGGRVALGSAVRTAEAEGYEDHTFNRPGTLHGAGNAIVPYLGAEFVGAAEEAKMFAAKLA